MSRRNGKSKEHDGCRIGPGGSPWFLVCIHVAARGAPAIAYPEQRDDLGYEGTVVCAQCDAVTRQAGRWDAIQDLVVGISSPCCRREGWLSRAVLP